MSSRNLEYLLAPRSVALIGASDRPGSVGATVMRNLVSGGFDGPVWAVNPRQQLLAGKQAYAKVADLPEPPDLAVICTPAQTVPGIISELGARGTRAAIVITAGLEAAAPGGGTLAQAMLAAAKPCTLRILGPNCLGLLQPRIGLNASFAHAPALPGNLAFIAQSGALATAMLDWARSANIGFSCLVSLGNCADVDFGDLLDYLCQDPHTRAILLYVEAISGARKFMSAARAAARNKPVIVVKAGRYAEGAKAAASHTGALAGADDVYDAAFRRAGILRVDTTRELFDAAETLARLRPLTGERLAIVSNGGGPAVMATDALISGGGSLASLSEATVQRLDALLPPNWSHGNPVDIVGDAPAARYAGALEVVLADPSVDAALLIHAPTAIVPATEIARVTSDTIVGSARPVLTCWMGGEVVREGRELFKRSGIPTYSTPEEAVSAFMHAVRHNRNQRQLMETPSSIPESFVPRTAEVQSIIAAALRTGRSLLTELEAKQVLAAYAIPVVATRAVAGVDEALVAAREIGYPVALKILSPEISHKSDVGGVALNLASDAALVAAARAMLERCKERCPDARIEGFTVQSMVIWPLAHELIVGVTTDPTFGPVILFGKGGVDVEVLPDKAIGFPPLNTVLAAELISQTRVKRILQGFRNVPPVDMHALQRVLVQVSQLAVDIGELAEIDINPLLAGRDGVIALDARMRVVPTQIAAADRLAIRPYPKELEETVDFDGQSLLIRPLRPEDAPQHREFIAHISAEDMQARFFRAVKALPPSELAYLTQLDYERAMAFIAVATDEHGETETLGVVRAQADPDNVSAEFAVLVRSDVKGHGLGSRLMEKIIRYCRERGLQSIAGDVLATNVRMLQLAAAHGFHAETTRDGVVRVTLALADLAATARPV
ncbi:MAG: bifunctional acetate--CoA ligase family protein/GNAT family N-acetyltransferase [Gammaproteobacteria bacterium]